MYDYFRLLPAPKPCLSANLKVSTEVSVLQILRSLKHCFDISQLYGTKLASMVNEWKYFYRAHVNIPLRRGVQGEPYK